MFIRDNGRAAPQEVKVVDMDSFEAVALINAHPSIVWEVITDGANYTVWDSGITAIDGEIRNGGTIRIRTRAGGARAFRLKVAQIPGEVMTWTGGLPLGLFRGVRTFTVTDESGRTRLHVKEEFTGPLLPLIRRSLPDMGRAFSDYVAAVKYRAEIIP